MSQQISARFQPFLGRTAEEIATELHMSIGGRAKSMHADITKRIVGVDPDNEIEDVNVRTIRLDFGKDKPRENISFPAFKFLDLVEQTWETSDLRSILAKPFLFVVFEEVEPGGRRVLVLVKLWRMPKEDLEGPVRQVWEETVRRILDGHAGQLPKMSESPICHVRPHGRDSRDTLPDAEERPDSQEVLLARERLRSRGHPTPEFGDLGISGSAISEGRRRLYDSPMSGDAP